MVLKGNVGVQKAYLQDVEDQDKGERQYQLYAYVKHLYQHYEDVFWAKVPYANEIKAFLTQMLRAEETSYGATTPLGSANRGLLILSETSQRGSEPRSPLSPGTGTLRPTQ